MSGKKYSLEMIISAMDKASGPVGKISRRVEDTFSRLEKVSSRVGQKMTRGVTLPVLGAGAMISRTGMDFEASMNKVQALTGATGKTLTMLEDKARDLGAKTKFSAVEAADAMAFLGMNGWEAQKIMTGIPAVLNLAAASNTELARTADIASNIMGAFKLEAKDMSRVADTLAATTAGSNVDMEMLSETMKQAAPIASMYGMTLEDTAAAAGLLGNIGLQGSLAGTGIKNSILGLVTGGSEAQKVMKALGVQVEKNGKLRNFASIMGDFGNSLRTLPEARRLEAINAVFGKIGLSAATELSNQAASGELEAFTRKLEGSKDRAEQMANILNSGMPKAWDEMKAAVADTMIELNKNGGIREIFLDVTGAIRNVSGAIKDMDKDTLKSIVKWAAIAAALGPVLILFGKVAGAIAIISKVVGPTFGALKMLGGGITWLAGMPAMLGTTWAAVFGALPGVIGGAIASIPFLIGAAIVGGIALIYTYWDEIKAWAIGVKDWISNIFGSIGSIIKEKATSWLPSAFSFSGSSPEKEGVKSQGSQPSVIQESSRSSFAGKMDVRFANAPQGMRIEKVEASGGSSIGYKTGYAMGI